MLNPIQNEVRYNRRLRGVGAAHTGPDAGGPRGGGTNGLDAADPTARHSSTVGSGAPGDAAPIAIAPATMPRIGTVDERFQSYNVEMVEVIGGRFWKPYGTQVNALLQAQPSAGAAGSDPVGLDPALFQERPPIDLTNPRLRTLAAALGPAYLRVSGTWANTTYFHDADTPPPATPPDGFNGVLTRQQWKGVIEFAHAVDAQLVTSVATSAGTRDAAGIWTPAQARRLLAYTTSIGGRIAGTEPASVRPQPARAPGRRRPPGHQHGPYGIS